MRPSALVEDPLDPRPALRPSLRLSERVAATLLLVAAAAATAFLAVPGLPPASPGEEALGSPAPATVRATRDLAVPDELATRRWREEAAADEPRVFDHDQGAADEVAARVRGAFQLMRGEAARWLERRPAARRDARAESSELARALAAHRDELASRLQLWLDDATFAALAEARFGEATEERLIAILRRGLSSPVVEDRALLAADRERGIRVREVRAGAVRSEHLLRDLDGLSDLAAARESLARDAAALPDVTARERAALATAGAELLRPSLVLSQSETERRRALAAAGVAPVVVPVRRGEVLVRAGERLERRHLVMLRGMQEQTRLFDRAAMRVGAGVLVASILIVLWVAAARLGSSIRPRRRGAVLLSALYLAMLAAAAGGIAAADALRDLARPLGPEAFSLLVPVPAGAAVAAMLLSPAAGVLLAIAVGASVGMLGGPSVVLGLQVTLASVAAALLLARVQRRRHVWRAGLAVGAFQAVLVASGWLFAGRARFELPPLDLAASLAAAFLSGAVLLPLVVVVAVPILERMLGLASDLRLRDLASLNHPALKELIVQAPGTWHHSVVTGALAEAAAEAIGADALLAKVGAHFHDLGKGRDPASFLENTRGENRLAEMPAQAAAARVRRHVEDGAAAARRWKLPRPVVDLVTQHHGTRLVSFFWSRDRQPAPGEAPLDPAFRYPGPRPQSREAALVMIADACEASSRELPDATPERLLQLVRRRIAEIVDEGQLDESELAIGDLDAIARAMAGTLLDVYRSRSATTSQPPPASDRGAPLQLVRP
ncbi:MAG TPA: HDIG domain-containing protein [Anaeromyxobacteraceae bacterium]|nr:HDIG domain-containing protein [Anaeromyxobacteraceae bacterium]